jgi:hypothetical protein
MHLETYTPLTNQPSRRRLTNGRFHTKLVSQKLKWTNKSQIREILFHVEQIENKKWTNKKNWVLVHRVSITTAASHMHPAVVEIICDSLSFTDAVWRRFAVARPMPLVSIAVWCSDILLWSLVLRRRLTAG